MNSKSRTNERWYTIARNIALVVAIFSSILSMLLIVNFIQTKSIDPLNSKALNQLMLQLQKDPENTALKEQIRALDLLARKAYFTYQWQIRTGSLLLFFFVLILILCLKYINSLRSKVPELLESEDIIASWEQRILMRRSLWYGGLVIFLLAFIAGILSEREIGNTGFETNESSDDNYMEKSKVNWPAFRGPGGNGIAYTSGYPTEWDGTTGKNIKWKIEVPKPGYNSPIIWGDLLFMAGADKTSQVVYGIDTVSGKILWQTELNNIAGSPEAPPRVSNDTGYAAPTMTTDGNYVFVIFATGDIACLDFTGAVVWAKNLGAPDNHYGHSSSLMVWKSAVLVQYDNNSTRELIALDTASGNVVYRTPRKVQISWASPILVNTGNRMEIILNSNPFVISYNPENGKELWRVECMEGEVAPSPSYSDGMVFVVNEYARLAAIALGEKAELKWETEDDLSEVASPVADKGLLFMPTAYGVVTCFDAKSGEKYWLHEFDDGFYSSPVIVDNMVYLIDVKGVMQIFNAKNEFQLINQSPIGEDAVTIPAFSGKNIFIRGVKNLYCIGKLE